MKPEERDALIRSYFAEDMELLQAKGHDYSGEEDALSNLRHFGFLGIIVRLSDKFSRIERLAELGYSIGEYGYVHVKDESIRDTLRDIRNYAFLAQIFLEGREKG